MQTKYIALADCDCFFVSCERKDNPALNGKPVCTMTPGGKKGIIVSRSPEAKKLGVKMGQPYFQVKEQFPDAICVQVRHDRYEEISSEVMNVYREFCPGVEVMSVDEAFLDLTGYHKMYGLTYEELIKKIRQTVFDRVGIPVSIGLGPSKALAKLASDKSKTTGGTFIITTDNIKELVGDMPIGDVSGVGRRNQVKLQSAGIQTINDFVTAAPDVIDQLMGITGKRLQLELSGTSVSAVDSEETAPQSIQSTGALADFTVSKDTLLAETYKHVHAAGHKLRAWQGYCGSIGVFLRTKDFKVMELYKDIEPTDSDFTLRKYANELLDQAYRHHVLYRSVGITLRNLTYGNRPASLFGTTDKTEKLSHIIDGLQDKFGKGVIKIGKQ